MFESHDEVVVVVVAYDDDLNGLNCIKETRRHESKIAVFCLP